MRTLVISDLHLGARAGRDVARNPAVLSRLCDAVEDADRLVLLGDTVEMLEGRPQGALRDAEPVLRALGAALGRSGEVVLAAGNHDRALVGPWLAQQQRERIPVGLNDLVPHDASPALQALTEWLGPGRVEVRYPGVDLGDGIWAHHGHYLDRHLLRIAPEGRSTPEDYERATGARATRIAGGMAAAIPGPIGDAIDWSARTAAKGAILSRPVVAKLPGAGMLAPLSAGAVGYQFRRSGLPAMAAVADHLGVEHSRIIFGHMHRAGPRDGDDREPWTVDGRELWNTGCWVYEPLLLAGTKPPSAYWPGGALVIEGGELRSLGLLDDMDPRELR